MAGRWCRLKNEEVCLLHEFVYMYMYVSMCVCEYGSRDKEKRSPKRGRIVRMRHTNRMMEGKGNRERVCEN